MRRAQSHATSVSMARRLHHAHKCCEAHADSGTDVAAHADVGRTSSETDVSVTRPPKRRMYTRCHTLADEHSSRHARHTPAQCARSIAETNDRINACTSNGSDASGKPAAVPADRVSSANVSSTTWCAGQEGNEEDDDDEDDRLSDSERLMRRRKRQRKLLRRCKRSTHVATVMQDGDGVLRAERDERGDETGVDALPPVATCDRSSSGSVGRVAAMRGSA